MEVKAENYAFESGPIPLGWTVRPLREIGKWYSGGTPRKSVAAFWSGEVPWVSAKDMKASRIHDSIDHISTEAVTDGARLMPKGAVLMVIRGMILAHSFPVARAEIPLAFNQDLKAVVIAEDIDSNFVLHWLIGNAQKLRGLTTESTHGTKRLSPETLFRVPFSHPSTKAEQEVIAGALSDADALIESLEQLVAKKRHVKQGAMQELLTGKRRLPGFGAKWEVRELRDVCCRIQDGTHFSPRLGGNDFLYVTSKNIGFGILDVSTAGRISTAEHAKIYARCDVKKGDLLLTKDGANTGNAALNELDEPFSLLSSVALLRFDSRNYAATYFLYQILSQDGQRQIKELMSGNAITRLTLMKIRSLRFPVPRLEEQTAIAAIVSEMDAEIAALEAKLAKAHLIKQGMMQELLTGRIRLV